MLTLDVTGSLARLITPSYGITDQELLAVRTSMKRYIDELRGECERGMHAWTRSIYDEATIKKVKDVAATAKQNNIQTVLWIGIGGSSLGPKVLQEVFETPKTMEFVVLDTIDPSTLQLMLDVLDWKHTFVVCVSKSGDTLETLSAFFLYWEKLRSTLGAKATDHALAITDAAKGTLRSFCLSQQIPMLPHPEVGGRYAIFTAVGLLPLALLDADLDAFLQGAADMEAQCLNISLDENPAAMLAAVQYVLESKKGYIQRVIMPYGQRLISLARWNQQLVAESLGKNEVRSPFPVAAIGTQDQHSLLQQWMQGPRKSWHLFIHEVEKLRLTVPKEVDPAFSFIAGKSYGQILDAFLEGTARALTSARRPHATINLTRLDAYHLGQLFQCFLFEVVYLGKLYRIDPYGQPGVELSKQITKDILQRG